MKILTFTDTHDSRTALKKIKEKSKNADVLVCGGDVTIFGDSQLPILRDLNKIGKPVIIVHGNHENSSSFSKSCKNLKNLHYVHNEIFTIDDVSFIGYGDGGFSLTDPGFAKLAPKLIRQIPKGNKFVLVSHGPPYGTKLDVLFRGSHCGSKDIMKIIKKYKPDIVVTGHLHENEGKKEKIGKTLVINPGIFGKMLKL